MIRNPYATFMSVAAPFVLIRLAHATEARETATMLAQLDTGADKTVIPAEVVEQISLRPAGTVTVAGLGGETGQESVYPVRLTVDGLGTVAIPVLASSGEPWVLLGRDVLNRYRIVLDGPNQTLEIS